jgi:FkbM family methyltransferase
MLKATPAMSRRFQNILPNAPASGYTGISRYLMTRPEKGNCPLEDRGTVPFFGTHFGNAVGDLMQAQPKLLTGDFNHLRKCRHGYVLYNFNDVYVGQSFELYGEFSEDEARLFEQVLRPGDVAMDIGANIGAFALVMAKRVGPTGKVYAFEPQRVVFQTLCANMALNSIGNAHCMQLALGDEPGKVMVPSFNYANTNNYGGVEVDSFNTGEPVPCVTLDSLEIPACRLMKIDVEGMEIKVLKGGAETIKRLKPLLYVENDRLDKSATLMKLIDSLDYDMYWHMPFLYSPNNLFGNPQNVFQSIASFNLLCVARSADMKITGFKKAAPTDPHPLQGQMA